MNIDTYLYVGTYNVPILMGTGEIYQGKGNGVHIFGMNSTTGEVCSIGVKEDIENTSYLTVDSKGKYLYAVNELDLFQGKPGGAVTALKIKEDGSLVQINQESSGGRAPCWLELDEDRGRLAVANYTSGSFGIYRLQEDGGLSPLERLIQHEGHGWNQRRQESPHVHSIALMTDGCHLVTADLGIDKIHVYTIGREGVASTAVACYEAEHGSGPRVVICHPYIPVVYVLNELSAELFVLVWDESQKTLERIQSVNTLKQPRSGDLAAGLILSPDGRYLYSTNRGENTIVVWQIDEKGMLQLVQRISTEGKTPRGICMSDDGRWILVGNQDSDFVVQYSRNQETGILTKYGKILVSTPVSLVMVRKIRE